MKIRLITVLIISTFSLYSQIYKVTGKITDDKTGKGIENVHVEVF